MKMKKNMIQYLFILMAALALIGCSDDNENNESNSNTGVSTNQTSQSEEVAEDAIRITISINEGEEFVDEKEVVVEDGELLMDVMEENFYIETAYDGKFITSIERVAADEEEKTSWTLFINGEMAMVGAADYEVSQGDIILFDLQSWE